MLLNMLVMRYTFFYAVVAPLSYSASFKLAAGSPQKTKKKFYVVTLWAVCENTGLQWWRRHRCNSSLVHLTHREGLFKPTLVHMDTTITACTDVNPHVLLT